MRAYKKTVIIMKVQTILHGMLEVHCDVAIHQPSLVIMLHWRNFLIFFWWIFHGWAQNRAAEKTSERKLNRNFHFVQPHPRHVADNGDDNDVHNIRNSTRFKGKCAVLCCAWEWVDVVHGIERFHHLSNVIYHYYLFVQVNNSKRNIRNI